MRIAVVIPTLQEAACVEAAVRSARAGSDPEVEILVVDGGSRDGTLERARAAGARGLASHPGRAHQLQAGLETCRDAEVVLFLHADTTLPPSWAAAVRRALGDPAVVGGAFGFRFREPGAALRVVEWGTRLRSRLGLPYGDQALFARREALVAVGGIPPVPWMEDLDLVRALRRRGRLALLPLDVETSARRYRERGVVRTVARHAAALAGFGLGLDRERLAAWIRR